MPPDKNQNINLLPSDLERQRRIIKQVIASAPKEYTKPANGHKEAKKISFWSKLFSAKPKMPAMQAKADHLALKPQLKPLVIDEALLPPPPVPPRPLHASGAAPPKPNFLSAAKFKHKIAPKAQGVAAVKPKKPSFWSKFFKAKPKKNPLAPAAAKAPATKEPFHEVKPNFAIEVKAPPAPVAAPKIEKAEKPAPKKIEMTEAANGGNGNSGGEDFGVNLLSAEYASAFVKQNQKSFFFYSAGAAAALVIIVYLGLHLYQIQKAGQVAKSQQANEELTTAINTFNDLDKEDRQLGKKVSAVKDLLAAHISTRAFLEKLESVIIPEVTFKALAATQDGGVTVSARAASYTALGRQLSVLQENVPWIKEVTMASAGAVTGNQGEDEGVEFDMVLRVDPAIFKAEQAK